MDEHRAQYLKDLGITAWVRRERTYTSLATGATGTPSMDVNGSRESGIAVMGWPELEQAVTGCTACGLRAGCARTVFGVGARQAEWMVIGEAPGADEDKQGEPFVGRAGQLLNSMLAAIGLKREQVYIANILKCRPPETAIRNPRKRNCAGRFCSGRSRLSGPS